MNTIKLVAEGTTEVYGYACGACQMIFNASNRDIADRCCLCTSCGKPLSDPPGHSSRHRECDVVLRRAERERARRAHYDLAQIPKDAEVLGQHDYAAQRLSAPVYCEALLSPFGAMEADHDGYFSCVSDLRAHCERWEIATPAWVFACDVVPLAFDAEAVLEMSTAELNEGAASEAGLHAPDLQRVLDEFAKAMQIPDTWTPDFDRVVVLATQATPEAPGCP